MSRAHLTHVRTIHTALNNFALSPSGTALAYSIGAVFLDDGEPQQLSSDRSSTSGLRADYLQ